MRRTLLCLTLLVGVLFTIGAAPGTASAANCTPYDDLTYVSGGGSSAVLYFNPGLSCNNVEAVRWYQWPAGKAMSSGWIDYDVGVYANSILGNCGGGSCSGNYAMLQQDVPGWTGCCYAYGAGIHFYQYASVWYYHSCRTLAQLWWFQIKNVVGHQWGAITGSTERTHRYVCVP